MCLVECPQEPRVATLVPYPTDLPPIPQTPRPGVGPDLRRKGDQLTDTLARGPVVLVALGRLQSPCIVLALGSSPATPRRTVVVTERPEVAGPGHGVVTDHSRPTRRHPLVQCQEYTGSFRPHPSPSTGGERQTRAGDGEDWDEVKGYQKRIKWETTG